ncbi:MAG: tetraacyldisaccharide 4'-kinase [Planctomycetota bacterium]
MSAGFTLGAVAGAITAPLGWLYGAAMALRNVAYDRHSAARLGVPVVSVGNLAAGGTGKTPLVVSLLERAYAAGRRPGVLARGYGRAAGAELNDEGMLLAGRFPGLLQVQDPDRVRGGRQLVARGADWVVLDDGFQHRRLHRDVDLVCLDAMHPFDRVLPAGLQREFASGLRRASAVVLTRADALDARARADLVRAVERRARRPLPVFASAHAPLDLVEQPEGSTVPLARLRGRRVVLLSAIARPQRFAATVATLGAEVIEHVVRRDHSTVAAGELETLAQRAAARDACLLVTEKDAVKMVGLPTPRLVLRIALRFEEPLPDELLLLR